MVKLISAEGFEFVIDLKAAMLSQTLGGVLTFPGPLSFSLLLRLKLSIFLSSLMVGGIMEKGHGELRLREISTPILEKICQYLYWALRFARFGSPSLSPLCLLCFS